MTMRSFHIVALFLIILFIGSFEEGFGNNGCSDTGDWSVYEGQCYSCIKDEVSWHTARSLCSQLGAHLVTISNSGIQNFLQNVCLNAYSWIGLNDISNEGEFVWDGTSSPISFSNWYDGEPNDSGGNEDCTHIYLENKWNDRNCESNLSYICQTPQDTDECLGSPCLHGSCIDQINSYMCHCLSGYTGENCETDIDECLSSPCLHGTCIDQLNSYKCQCQPGYTGTNCEYDTNECISSPCQHGTCIDKIDSYACNCSPGYSGENCDTDVDECQSSPCIHGNCSDLVNEYKCQCFPGFEGPQCQIDTDECLSSPCNHGTCIDKTDSYACKCSSGFSGRNCEMETDECSSSPCSHGSCINKVNSFECDCHFGYKGISCDQFKTELLFILFTCLPFITLILSLFLCRKKKQNKVEDDLEIVVLPDALSGESKP